MDSIQKALELFFAPDISGSILEIRALKCWDRNPEYQHNRIGYFDDLAKAVSEVEALERKFHPTGIYVTLNPVKQDLLARASNRIKKAEKDSATSNTDIVSRRWMLVDFDPVRPSGVSSTELELWNAREQARLCGVWLADNGFGNPVAAMSGNGFHLLYRIDEPAEDDGLIKGCLKSLSEKFSTAEVSCDTKNFNAARITKLYGTLTCKGDATPDRPHRRSELVDVPQDLKVVPRERLEWLAGLSFVPKHHNNKTFCDDTNKLLVDKWLTRHNISILSKDESKDGATRFFITCPGKSLHTSNNSDTDCCITQDPNSGQLGGHCFHNSCGMSDWQALKSAIGPIEYEDFEHGPDVTSQVDLSFLSPTPKKTSTPEDLDPETPDSENNLDPENPDSNNLDEHDQDSGGEFPWDCLRPPGLIGEIVDYNLQTAKYPQPEHALAGALSLMSLITGRRVEDRSGTRTNLMIVALGPTRSGKEHPRQINKKILEYCGQSNLYEEKLASHASLHGFLKTAPAGLLMNDEFGDFLALARSTKGANTQPAQIISAMIKIYSSSSGIYKADRYADNAKQITINQPHLVLYGTSTAEVFWKHVTPEYLSGGLFGRVMLFQNRGYVDPVPSSTRGVGLSESILNAVKYWLNRGMSDGLLAWENPTPAVVPHTPDALDRFEAHELEIASKRKIETPIRAALWSGTAEITAKLALLFACSRSRNPLQIQIEDVNLAIRLSNWLTRQKVALSGENVAENATESNAKRVLRLIKSAGRKGLSRSDITRKTQWLKTKERDEIIRDLIAGEFVCGHEARTKTNTKTIYLTRNWYLKIASEQRQKLIAFT